MTDVNCMLANAASMWRARADQLDRDAAAMDAEGARLDATTPGVDLGRPYKADAAAGREKARRYREKALYADKGQYWFNPQEVPDGQEQRLQAECARAGRLVFPNSRDVAGISFGS